MLHFSCNKVGVKRMEKQEQLNEKNKTNSIMELVSKKNGWAIVGLACAIGGVNIIGLIASIFGIKSAKKNYGEFISFAVAGLVISLVHIIRILIVGFHSFIFPVIDGTEVLSTALWNFFITMITTL